MLSERPVAYLSGAGLHGADGRPLKPWEWSPVPGAVLNERVRE